MKKLRFVPPRKNIRAKISKLRASGDEDTAGLLEFLVERLDLLENRLVTLVLDIPDSA